jgi:hypothetical protein
VRRRSAARDNAAAWRLLPVKGDGDEVRTGGVGTGGFIDGTTASGQRRPVRPMRARRTVTEPMTGGPHPAANFQNKLNPETGFLRGKRATQ